MRVVLCHIRPLTCRRLEIIARHVTRRNARRAKKKYRCRREMDTVAGVALAQKPERKILALRRAGRVEAVGLGFGNIFCNCARSRFGVGSVRAVNPGDNCLQVRADIVRQLRIGPMNKPFILRVPVRRFLDKCGFDRIFRQLTRIFDVSIKNRFSACGQLQRPVRKVVNGGLHVRFDLQLVDRVQPEGLHIRRKQHAGAYPRAVIILLRQRHPAAVFIDSHRIRTQVAGSGKIGINLHHAPASFTLGTDSFEIHARHVRVPDPSAECARSKGRDEFHLSGRGVSAEDREFFRRPADHGRETFGPCRTFIAVSRKKQCKRSQQNCNRNHQVQRQPVPGLGGIEAQLLRQDQQRQRACERQHRKRRRLSLQNDQTDDEKRQTCQKDAQQRHARKNCPDRA